MKKSIVWLASYPKSGNTWTRVFLANYLANREEPLAINDVHRFGMGDSIAKSYQMVTQGRVDLNDQAQVLKARDLVLQAIVRNNADVNFVKTHNICGSAHNVELIPERYTRSAVYIIRNPLDVVLSFARHFGYDQEHAVTAMGHSHHVTTPDGPTIWQFLGSWTDHVQSWTLERRFPVLVLRYEDLLTAPEEHFGRLLEHIGIPPEAERLEKAIRFSSFKELKKQEDDSGFVEKSPKTDSFFAKGTSGQWKTDLPPELARKLRKQHRKTMKKFGYLE
ncbi:MAG: sulfotransferase domain-containing protein [Alphaproteobacteria bacterium]|jgi:hypothetical protein|nr:sulfotransferase domain-containing protein [Alphaproteobacteria bacterium]